MIDMERNNIRDKLIQINTILGFDIRDYEALDKTDIGEIDNRINPFDKLSLEDLLFVREFIKECNDITKKLGFNPKTYIPCKHKYYDDVYESPFSVLTADETRFLLNISSI